jgi:hypothetical protein
MRISARKERVMLWECSECGGRFSSPDEPLVCHECGIACNFFVACESASDLVDFRDAWLQNGLEQAGRSGPLSLADEQHFA